MELVKLEALRDFAIQHIPRAQRIGGQAHSSQDSYHLALYGAATLTLASATASAIERSGANLLQSTMLLMADWSDRTPPTARQRYEFEQDAFTAATDLCSLTSTSLPWLRDYDA